jgi:plasmid replication initiation protein
MRHRTRDEREQLELFRALPGDLARRDAQDLMAYPFFSLAKTHRTTPIDFRMNEIAIRVEAVPEHGMATIWDADVLIWAASQIVEARDAGLRTSRLMVTTPREILAFTRRDTGARDYHRLKAALDRLQSTTVATSLRQTTERRMHRFSWINEWTERADAHGNADGIDLIMPDWFYRAVLDDALVLTIDPAYFGLTGGLERWLYRLVRKHAGHQRGGWRFDFRHLPSSRRASRRSSASHSSCATSRAASPCRATGSRSNGRAAGASCWRSRPPSYPQEPVHNLWNRTCFREPMGTCHQEPDPRAIRNRKPGFPQAVQSLPSRLT